MTDNRVRYEIVISLRTDDPYPHIQPALSEIILDPAVASVLLDHRIDSDREYLRIILGFEDESDVSRLRSDPEHLACLCAIERNTDGIETSVWEPTAVELVGSTG